MINFYFIYFTVVEKFRLLQYLGSGCFDTVGRGGRIFCLTMGFLFQTLGGGDFFLMPHWQAFFINVIKRIFS